MQFALTPADTFETVYFFIRNRPSVHTKPVNPETALQSVFFLDPTGLVNSCGRQKPDIVNSFQSFFSWSWNEGLNKPSSSGEEKSMRNSVFVSICESKSDSCWRKYQVFGFSLTWFVWTRPKLLFKMASPILNPQELFHHLQEHLHIPKGFKSWDKLAFRWGHSKCCSSS